MATRMILIRHGDTGLPWGTFVGSTDCDLKKGAVEKARGLGERLEGEGIRAIYTSQLKRAWKTAEAIGDALDLKPERVRELNEMDFGEVEGRFIGDVEKEQPERVREFLEDMWDFRWKGGESFSQVRKRAMPMIKELFRRHKGETFAVVAHGNVNAIAESVFTGKPVEDIIHRGLPFLSALFFKKDGDNIVLERSWGVDDV